MRVSNSFPALRMEEWLAHLFIRLYLAIEMQFAVAAVEQSEVYWNLITKIQPSKLTRLTQSEQRPFVPALVFLSLIGILCCG